MVSRIHSNSDFSKNATSQHNFIYKYIAFILYIDSTESNTNSITMQYYNITKTINWYIEYVICIYTAMEALGRNDVR